MKTTINLCSAVEVHRGFASLNDDHPETSYYPGYKVEVAVDGFIERDGLKYRASAAKEHSVKARVQVCTVASWISRNENTKESEIVELKRKAEAYALEIGEILESRGFEVELTFQESQMNFRNQFSNTEITWLDEVPPVFKKQIGRIEIRDLNPQRN